MGELFSRQVLKKDRQSLLDDYENIPHHQKDFYLLDDLFVHKNLLRIKDNYRNLMQSQGNKDLVQQKFLFTLCLLVYCIDDI